MRGGKATNKYFPTYDGYLKRQRAKPRQTGQRGKGGLKWEYRIQLPCKPMLVKRIKKYASPSCVKSILVLGARWGADVQFLREGGYDCSIDAIDIHDPPLSDLVRYGDAHDLSDVSKPIDLVWAYHVFEHFWSPTNVLKQLNDVCSPRAVMFVAHPLWTQKDKYDAQDEYSGRAEFEELLSDNGWAVVGLEPYHPKPGKPLTPAYVFMKAPVGADA